MPLECQKDLFGTFHTVGVGREGAWGLCPKRELGVCQLRLPMFIMLVIFLDILLVVSILNIVYDCHLWPILHFCPEGVVNNFCGIYGYIFAWELPFLMFVCVCVCVCVCVRARVCEGGDAGPCWLCPKLRAWRTPLAFRYLSCW